MQTETKKIQIINREGTLLGLMGRDGMKAFAGAAYSALDTSFKEANMRNPTQAEIRRRFEICVKWAKVLRGDLGWGIARICDTLTDALRTELLGQEFKPSERACWMPGDGR